MAKIVFGEALVPIEEFLLTSKKFPIRSIDILRYVRDEMLLEGEALPKFAIGPDINPNRWSGIDEIYQEGFDFIRLPQTLTVRSTLIREKISTGQSWDSFVSNEVADYIKLHNLYGYHGYQ
jgi:hypothetical protein